MIRKKILTSALAAARTYSSPAIRPLTLLLLTIPLLLLAAKDQGQAAGLVYPLGIQILPLRYTVNTPRPAIMPQEVLIKFRPGVNNSQILAILSRYQLREVAFSPYSGIRKCLLPAQILINQAISFLQAEPAILYAEPNWVGYSHFIPNDPFLPYQWHLPLINANLAWDISTGAGVVVAVLDTGVAFENFDIYALAPDLAGTSFVPGYDFVNDDPNPDDDEGHGTHIAGTIAQTTNNGLGCAGVAFGVSIMPVKVMDNTGSGTLTDIVDGIYYAANNGAKIINMSLGFGNNPTLALEDAVNYASSSGCLLVCSAGNSGINTPNYPASYPVCISVSGVRYDLTLGSYSNYGPDIDLCAPGGDLTLDQNLDGYPDGILQQTHDGANFKNFGFYMGRGTSWAAACVSGVAALVISASAGALDSAGVRSILETTARDLGAPGWDEYFGWGLVDAYAATAAAAASAATVLGVRVPFAPQSVAAVPKISLQGASPTWWLWQQQQTQLGLLMQLSQPQVTGLGQIRALRWIAPGIRSSQQSVPVSILAAGETSSPSLPVAQIMGLSDWLFPLMAAPLQAEVSAFSPWLWLLGGYPGVDFGRNPYSIRVPSKPSS
ncbi:MAG: S8 family peptidase [bacterium]|nr:S8 family peptidase [bacterium]